jgi:hypothetical protein
VSLSKPHYLGKFRELQWPKIWFPEFKSWFFHFLAGRPWADSQSSSDLNFLIRKMRIAIISTPEGFVGIY